MKDELFVRGNVPMTKEEIRAIIISKLNLTSTSVMWDIGAGTGSVSIEAACSTEVSKICCFEKNPEGIQLIKANMEKFGCSNLEIHEGVFPDAFADVLKQNEIPTHAFIGGSDGRVSGIMDLLSGLNPDIRIVMTAVTLETIAEITDYINKNDIDAEVVWASISKTRQLGRYHMMSGMNPVAIISFGGID